MSDLKAFVFGSFSEDEIQKIWIHDQVPKKSDNDLTQNGLQSSPRSSSSSDSLRGTSLSPQGTQRSTLPKRVQKARQSVVGVARKNQNDTVAKISQKSEAQSNENGKGYSNCISESERKLQNIGFISVTEEKNCTREETALLKDDDNDNGVEKSGSQPGDIAGLSTKKEQHLKILLPRGLMNSGNICFINSTLQALLSCAPFVRLLEDVRARNIPKVGYPTLSAFVNFISNFDMPDDSSSIRNARPALNCGFPFSPTMFDPVLRIFNPELSRTQLSRQEDAQEFLSFIMDQMHDELLKLDGQSSHSNGSISPLLACDEDDGWETVGPKNKSAIMRTQKFIPSELSAIFGGQLRSVVRASGIKASATIQPFLLLHLDIHPETVNTIEDALLLFTASETLEGYKASAGKAGVVSASKSVKIESLPKIMILHLKRFSYGSRGSTKLLKPVSFPLELVLANDLLVFQASEGRKYELVATITHHGREPSRGHYTADAKYFDGRWLRYDDASVIAVGANKVLHEQAYVLFYKQI